LDKEEDNGVDLYLDEKNNVVPDLMITCNPDKKCNRR